MVLSNGDMSVELVRLKGEWLPGGDYAYVVVPAKSQFVRIDVLTSLFFSFSAFMHGIWVVFGGFEHSKKWLWLQIDYCCVPTRWIEYSFSASLMAVGIAIISGLREQNSLAGIFFLHFSTMCFGLLTELYSRPAIDPKTGEYDMTRWEGDPVEEETSAAAPLAPQDPQDSEAAKALTELNNLLAKNPEMVVSAAKSRGGSRGFRKWTNYCRRMLPHLCGIFPFVAAWVIVANHLSETIGDLCVGIQEAIPDFVIPALAGSITIFSSFTLIQIRYQFSPPIHYWRTEVWYCALSVTAKVYLGSLLLLNVIQKSSFNAALESGNTNVTNWNASALC